MSVRLFGPHLASEQAPRQTRYRDATDERESPGATWSQIILSGQRHNNQIATLLGPALFVHRCCESVSELDRSKPTFAVHQMAIRFGRLDGCAQECDPTLASEQRTLISSCSRGWQVHWREGTTLPPRGRGRSR
jgi:hypothetical protein